jgi:peptidoglycan/xylan/chitin deacetylase (PgdA/CDA1 family)
MKVFAFILVFIFQQTFAQKEVSITIDDVPNVELNRTGGTSLLLQHITDMNIPAAVFINEKNLHNNASEASNLRLLESWLNNKNITAGNHTYSHLNYTDTTLEAFKDDVVKGERLTTKILKRRPVFFRFPFNSLGNDSLQHRAIKKFLADRGYTHVPFTIESEDWAYNAVYENALKQGDSIKAKEVGQRYVAYTVSLFQYFETLTRSLYGRSIKQIYLCHDNLLNTAYLPQLIASLKKNGYQFISLGQALTDDAYNSKEYYFGRYGFSWIYRWQASETARRSMMRNEPSNEALHREYGELTGSK